MSIYYAVGRYACKITEQALGEAKTGTPQFVLRFRVMGLVDSKDPSRYIPADQEYERTCYRAITEKTIPYLMEELKTLEFEGQSFRDLDPNSPNFQDFRGRDVDMWCNHEDGQDGQKREKWGVARVGGPLEVKPLEPKKLRDLDNLFGRHLKDLKDVGKATTKPQATPAPVGAPNGLGITDDDVPF